MAIVDWIPQTHGGYLAYWQLFVAVTALFNTVQNFVTIKFTRRLYPLASPVTPLQARTFAIWTLTSAAIRFYAAYNIHVKQFYDLALLSYLFAFLHFGSEVFIFRTSKIPGPVLSTFFASVGSLVWMLAQYDFYTKH